MQLRFTDKDGVEQVFVLPHKAITIGRGLDADLVIKDEKASRLHCAVERFEGECLVRDLKSKNGLTVNGERVESAYVVAGDTFQAGGTVFLVEELNTPGSETAIQEVQDEMEHGKGYGTIMRELVKETDAPAPKKISDTERITMRPPPKKPKKLADTERIPLEE